MLRIGLWMKKSQQGNSYIGGKMPGYLLNGAWINIYKNEKKESPNQPDYFLVLNEDDSHNQKQSSASQNPQDDIPF